MLFLLLHFSYFYLKNFQNWHFSTSLHLFAIYMQAYLASILAKCGTTQNIKEYSRQQGTACIPMLSHSIFCLVHTSHALVGFFFAVGGICLGSVPMSFGL
jgi:hypothetical protein